MCLSSLGLVDHEQILNTQDMGLRSAQLGYMLKLRPAGRASFFTVSQIFIASREAPGGLYGSIYYACRVAWRDL